MCVYIYIYIYIYVHMYILYIAVQQLLLRDAVMPAHSEPNVGSAPSVSVPHPGGSGNTIYYVMDR